MAVYFIKYICWEIVLFNYFRNLVSDTKAAVLEISKFYLNVISIVIWEFIFHVTETLRRPSGLSGSHYYIFLR